MDRSQLVIVALPSEHDEVRKVSSETEPHLTLLYLGTPDYDVNQIKHVIDYVEHASSLLRTFMLDVDKRGVLGDKQADVLFFNKKWTKEIATFREHLLQDPLIYSAYASSKQFDGWTPHLTLGYPETPAKKRVKDDYPITYVRFDRIAVWIGDSEGPVFPLPNYSDDMEVAMSEIKSPSSVVKEIGAEALKHYGVKGMKWGIRRSGADKPPASQDVETVDSHKQIIKAGSTRALSNKELREVVDRMNLEQQYSSLVSKEGSKIKQGHNQVKKILALGETAQKAYNMVNSPAGKALRKAIIGV